MEIFINDKWKIARTNYVLSMFLNLKFDHIKACELNAHQPSYQNQYWKMCDGGDALKHNFLK